VGFTSGRPASTDAYVSEASCIDDTMRKLQRARNICLHPDSISGVKEKFFFFFLGGAGVFSSPSCPHALWGLPILMNWYFEVVLEI
jgi:hypothetical protein